MLAGRNAVKGSNSWQLRKLTALLSRHASRALRSVKRTPRFEPAVVGPNVNALHRFAAILALLAALLSSGCATLDFSYPRPESEAINPADTVETRLGKRVAKLAAGKPPAQSGFYMLPDPVDAFAARLLLARRAERTIDVQYYLIKADIAGITLVRELILAADRGVRVRLLVDDMFTSGSDPGWAAVDHHPNIEVRIFNPFAHRSGRFRDGLINFSRINRRMHNKSFTVDNQITIVGGRNIAGEYFAAKENSYFSDLDVIGIGPVVGEISTSFDAYWNHERAMPVPAFADMPDDLDAALEKVRWQLDEAIKKTFATQNYSVYGEAVQRRAMKFLADEEDMFTWAPYEVAVDSPDKAFKDRAETAESILGPLRTSLRSAQEQIVIISPYFVPLSSGVEALSRLEERGVDVTVITNSLAANNQFAVHGGYAPSRKPLLEAGVEIYEVRRDAKGQGQEFIAASGAKSTLHTKAFVVDRRELFIGSFNFDPRSGNINTELGIIIRSPALARASVAGIEAALPTRAWRLEQDERGRLRWHGVAEDGMQVVHTTEPQTSWWDRAVVGFVRLLPIRGQL